MRSAATPVVELSASLDHIRRDLQFLRNDILSLSWRSVGDTFTTGCPFRSDSLAHFNSVKKSQNLTSNPFHNERNRRNFKSASSRSVNRANSILENTVIITENLELRLLGNANNPANLIPQQ